MLFSGIAQTNNFGLINYSYSKIIVVRTCAEDFVFVIHEDTYKNFFAWYSVDLIFKNKASFEILNLSLGKFNILSATVETFNICWCKTSTDKRT